MSNWVGKKVGKVQIESLVGRGGVAEVYLGTHITLDRKVAVKILRSLGEEETDKLSRFEREARVIAKLRHPNIVQVHDFDTIENDPYLVMEYIEGPSLAKYLNTLHQNHQRLEVAQVIRLLNAIASALQYAHNSGVIHRDIKPGNILLTSPSSQITVGEPLPQDFEPILTDFGLVRFLDASRETATGHIVGTPAYMSPEQARGEATDGRTDVYSLGIVLYEILAGHVPFEGETTVGILLKQVHEPPAPIPELSPMLQSAIGRALAKDPKDRFQTPMEFANAFSAAVEMRPDAPTMEMDNLSLDVPPPVTEPPIEQPVDQPAKPRPPWFRPVVLGLLLIALLGFVFINQLPSALSSASETITAPVPSGTYTIQPATATTTLTSTQPAPETQGPGILRFQDGDAIADQVSLIVGAMPAPPAGSEYEVWLIGASDRLSLGSFSPGHARQDELLFAEPEGLNLLALYDRVEITIEPSPDSDPEASDLIAYSFTLSTDGLTHLRYLLSEFPGTPNKNPLIQGLYTNIEQINELAKEMQTAIESGDKDLVQGKAEDALNLLVGAKSADYKDWNGDGQIIKTDGYGLLVNGSNFGYIQAVYAEADFIVNTADATEYMIENGEVVKTCTQNLTLWAPPLRELLLTVLTSTSDTEVSKAIDDLVILTDQMLNGIDIDSNGTINTVSGECGADLAYEYAYYMADMPILPVSISYQLTVVANPGYIAPTRTRQPSENNQDANIPKEKPTKKPNPGNDNKDKKKP